MTIKSAALLPPSLEQNLGALSLAELFVVLNATIEECLRRGVGADVIGDELVAEIQKRVPA